jgi:hypothetical protein
MQVNGQLKAPAALTPRQRALCTHWIGGWVGPRGGLDDVEKSVCSCQESNPDSSDVQPVALHYTGLLFSTHDRNQNPHTGGLTEHTGTFPPSGCLLVVCDAPLTLEHWATVSRKHIWYSKGPAFGPRSFPPMPKRKPNLSL